mmetsp:Transcript_30483/g.98479  ORF Transcript_30483/g.98479 Transcript_30483/m.98479 type:complete len:224 (+) Transcript_30483:3907-4578(+)
MQPMATHSPWSILGEAMPSMAWPIVWPKLSVARTPDSFSSSATTSALRRTASVTTLWMRSGCSALIASTCSSIRSKSGAQRMHPILIASARPSTISRWPSERSSSRSMHTRRGWWNAPMRFFPAGTLTAVFPPTDESSIAIMDVGTCTTGTPRMNVAATKPVRSPTTPPPSATMQVSRMQRCDSMKSSICSLYSRFLELSPGLISKVSAVWPAAANASTRCCP